MEGGASDVVMMYIDFPHSFYIYTEALYCSRIRCLGVNVPYVTDSLTGMAVL